MADFPVSWPERRPSLSPHTDHILTLAADHIRGLQSKIDTGINYQLQDALNFGRGIDQKILAPIEAGLKQKPRLLSRLRKTIEADLDNRILAHATAIEMMRPGTGGAVSYCVFQIRPHCYQVQVVPLGGAPPPNTVQCFPNRADADLLAAQLNLADAAAGTPCSTVPVTVPAGDGGGITPSGIPCSGTDIWCIYQDPNNPATCFVHRCDPYTMLPGFKQLACFPTYESAVAYWSQYCGGSVTPTVPGGGGGCPSLPSGSGGGCTVNVTPQPAIIVNPPPCPAPTVTVNVSEELLSICQAIANVTVNPPSPILPSPSVPGGNGVGTGGGGGCPCPPPPGQLLGPALGADGMPGVAQEQQPPDCAIKGPFNLGIPTVGSPEWCVFIHDFVIGLADLGYKFLSPVADFADYLTSAPSGLTGAIGGLIATLLNFDSGLKDMLKNIVKCIPELIKHTSRCDPNVYVGIVVCRALIGILKKLRVGTDAIAWLTADIEATFPQIEEVIEYVQKYVCPVEIPGKSEAIAAYLHSTITIDQYRCWLLMNGADPGVWEPVLLSEREQPTVHEKIDLRNRLFFDDAGFRDSLRQSGVIRQTDLAAYEELRKELPGPSDMVRFAVRHVFEPDLIEYFGYNDEFRPAFKYWHEKLGFFYDARSPDEIKAGRKPYSWAEAHWWAHWILPSPTQGYEMYFRLRPDRDRRREPPWMASQTFTQDDLRLLLRANDYPPFWRDKLAAVAQRLPTQRQMVQLVRAGVWQQKNVEDNLLSMGYTPANAKDLATALMANENKPKADPLLRQIIRYYEEAWYLGIYDDNAFMQAMLAAGVPQDDAVKRLFLTRVRRQLDAAKTLIKNLRDRFLAGELNEDTARRLLAFHGIFADHIDQYLTDWKEERLAPRKTIAAAQAKKDACDGLLSLEDLTSRLVALGYNAGDISVLIGETQLCQVNRAAAGLARQIAAGKARRKELEYYLRQQRVAANQARSALSRHGTPKDLQKWLTDELISEAEVLARLSDLGWPEDDRKRVIEEALLARSKRNGAKTKG